MSTGHGANLIFDASVYVPQRCGSACGKVNALPAKGSRRSSNGQGKGKPLKHDEFIVVNLGKLPGRTSISFLARYLPLNKVSGGREVACIAGS